jgi:hypothetical protein
VDLSHNNRRVALVVDALFPGAMRRDAAAVASIVPYSRLAPTAPFVVRVDGQPLSIPYRIYND